MKTPFAIWGLVLATALMTDIPSKAQSLQLEASVKADPCATAFASVVARAAIDREIEGYRRCSETRPKAGFPHYNLGILYEAQENWNLADKEFRTALLLGLSSIVDEKAQRELKVIGVRLHESAAERAYTDHLDRASRAKRYFRASQFLDALQLARSLTLDSFATVEDFLLLGTIEFAMTDYSDALRTLLRAKQMSPTSSQTQVEFLLKRTADESECLRLTTAAQLAFKKHDPVQAGDLFSAAWRLHPERADIGFAAVTSYLATSQSNRSLPILNVLSLSPSSNVAQRAEAIRSALADIDRSIYERHRKAQEVLKGIASRYKSPEDLTDLSAKKLATLEHDTQQVLLIAPNLVEAHRLLAFCLMRERKYAQAIDQYRAVLTINPKCQGRSKSRPVRRSKREPLERSGVLLGLRGRGPLERSGRGLRPREARLAGWG